MAPPARRPPDPSADAPRLDITGRPVRLRTLDLDRFFHPRTIAVIGASAVEGKPNNGLWRQLRTWGERAGATVVPVHPTQGEIDGVPCVASVADIDDHLDLAVILVGDAVAVFESVLDHRPDYAVIFSAGFAEVGADGAALQQRLATLVEAGGTHLLGPNTNLNAFETFRDDLPGPTIALITQSGHQGRPVFQAQQFGIALSHWAPTGNEVDLEFADFAAYFADRPEVGVVAAYIEGFKDGRTLMLAADHAASVDVPIVCIKVGRTAEGRSMARSHTGHLTGSDAVTDAVFRQFGITRVDGLDELTETAAMFARTAASRSADATADSTGARPLGVCVYAISGGTGAHMADLLADAGLVLPELRAATQQTLQQWIPPYLRVSNPVDSGGPPSTDERGPRILEALIADPGVDLIICPITGALDRISRPLATDLVAAAATTDKPIFVVWGSPDTSDPVYTDVLLPSSLPTFRTFHNCVAAARAYADRRAFRARYESPFAPAAVPALLERSPAGAAVEPLLAGAGALDERYAKQVLQAYGIATTTDLLATSATAAGRAAATIGFPVVMKVCSPDLPHKSDHGLVEIGVASAADARRAYARLVERAQRTDPTARIEGVLVSELVTGGVECVVGLAADELFGPTVMFGLGGVFVEVLRDVTFRVPPFSRREAERMLLEVQGAPLLLGARGRSPADLGALADVIMAVQRLALDHGDTIAEIDINPLVARADGAVALDALVVLHQPT